MLLNDKKMIRSDACDRIHLHAGTWREQALGAAAALSWTEYFVWGYSGAADLKNPKRVKVFIADLSAEVRSGLKVFKKQFKSCGQSSPIRSMLHVLATMFLSFLALSTFFACFNREVHLLSVFMFTLTAFRVAFSHVSKVKPGMVTLLAWLLVLQYI